MKKIAIIIKSEANDLPGVVHDEINFWKFLKSPYGGEWHDSEFYTISTPPAYRYSNAYLSSELEKIRNGGLEYAIVLYSGHGGINKEQEFVIYPNNGLNVKAEILCGLAQKQLTIFDCCREIDKKPEMIKEAATASRSKCLSTRSLYEQLIHKAMPQQNFLFACGVDECAQDTSNGALYFGALLNSAKTYTDPKRWKTVKEAHDLAAAYVRLRSFDQQHPDCLIPKITRERCLPFSINPEI